MNYSDMNRSRNTTNFTNKYRVRRTSSMNTNKNTITNQIAQ